MFDHITERRRASASQRLGGLIAVDELIKVLLPMSFDYIHSIFGRSLMLLLFVRGEPVCCAVLPLANALI